MTWDTALEDESEDSWGRGEALVESADDQVSFVHKNPLTISFLLKS